MRRSLLLNLEGDIVISGHFVHTCSGHLRSDDWTYLNILGVVDQCIANGGGLIGALRLLRRMVNG